MNHTALLLIAALAAALAPATARADKVYAAGKGATWDCKKDPVVTINHGRGTYTFQGPCKSINLNGGQSTVRIEDTEALNITGASNTVTVGQIDQINLVGAGNKVTWRKAKHGDKPGITNVGTNNQIESGGAPADK